MFPRSFRIGKIAGFDIEANITFLILLALVVATQGLVAGLVLAVLVFGSVLLHELGHALVARAKDVPIAGIELHFFGGVAKMVGAPRSATDEILIAAAGPAVSLTLGGTGLLLWWLTGVQAFLALGYVNMVLGVFNLLPALPMDGGRILRAALSRKMGRLEATYKAVRISHAAAVVMGVGALLAGEWMLALIAVVLYLMASQEKWIARSWHYRDEEPQMEILDHEGHSVGWYDQSGRRVDGPSDWEGSFGPGPWQGPGGPTGPHHQRRIHRMPGGGYIVIEHHRW